VFQTGQHHGLDDSVYVFLREKLEGGGGGGGLAYERFQAGNSFFAENWDFPGVGIELARGAV
jgi:hypothetical protein